MGTRQPPKKVLQREAISEDPVIEALEDPFKKYVYPENLYDGSLKIDHLPRGGFCLDKIFKRIQRRSFMKKNMARASFIQKTVLDIFKKEELYPNETQTLKNGCHKMVFEVTHGKQGTTYVAKVSVCHDASHTHPCQYDACDYALHANEVRIQRETKLKKFVCRAERIWKLQFGEKSKSTFVFIEIQPKGKPLQPKDFPAYKEAKEYLQCNLENKLRDAKQANFAVFGKKGEPEVKAIDIGM